MVGFSMSDNKGKKPPSLYKMYPKLFEEEAEYEAYLNFRNALLAKSRNAKGGNK